MVEGEKPLAAFVLSLIGGALMLAGGVAALWWASMHLASMSAMMTGQEMTEMMRTMGGMMGMMGMMSVMGFGMPMFGLSPSLGLVSGVTILVSAFMLYRKPQEAVLWGALILAFSLVSLVGLRGFFVGGILGIVGGVLALTLRLAKPG